jgi:hypothetical protein
VSDQLHFRQRECIVVIDDPTSIMRRADDAYPAVNATSEGPYGIDLERNE